jgi:hypothetical protein
VEQPKISSVLCNQTTLLKRIKIYLSIELITTNKIVSLEFLFCVVLGSYDWVVILTVPRGTAPPGAVSLCHPQGGYRYIKP